MPTEPLRAAMLDYGVRILILSAVISIFTATLLSVTMSGGWSGPIIGPGGYIGALSHGLMLQSLGPIGVGLVAACGALFGLIIVTGNLPIRIAALTATAAIGTANRRRGNGKRRGEGLSVLIGGKRSTLPADEEVDERLHNIMKSIHKSCVETAEKYGEPGNYVLGANISGFIKIADSMLDQGLV